MLILVLIHSCFFSANDRDDCDALLQLQRRDRGGGGRLLLLLRVPPSAMHQDRARAQGVLHLREMPGKDFNQCAFIFLRDCDRKRNGTRFARKRVARFCAEVMWSLAPNPVRKMSGSSWCNRRMRQIKLFHLLGEIETISYFFFVAFRSLRAPFIFYGHICTLLCPFFTSFLLKGSCSICHVEQTDRLPRSPGYGGIEFPIFYCGIHSWNVTPPLARASDPKWRPALVFTFSRGNEMGKKSFACAQNFPVRLFSSPLVFVVKVWLLARKILWWPNALRVIPYALRC